MGAATKIDTIHKEGRHGEYATQVWTFLRHFWCGLTLAWHL